MFNKKSDAKQGMSLTEKKPGVFDYNALKSAANDHEREGRWHEAAEVWTAIASKSNNPMVVKMARQKAEAAKLNAREHCDTQPTRETVLGRDGEPVAVVVPGREADAPTANDDATGAPVEEAAHSTANDAPTAEPGAEEAAAPAPKPRDARLPEVGTVIQKRDRKGELRCECKVVEGGIEYKGTTYKSLSSAALAASKDLGLGASTLDGWAWWGLKERPAVPGAKKDLAATLERAFAKYRERVAGIVKSATSDDLIKVGQALKAQSAELNALVELTESARS